MINEDARLKFLEDRVSKLRDTIEEQDKQIEALKRDVLEKTAEVRNLKEVIADLHNQADDDLDSIETERIENARLKADVERLTLLQVETLSERNKAEAKVERLTKAGDAMEDWIAWKCESPIGTADGILHAWNAAKDGKDAQ